MGWFLDERMSKDIDDQIVAGYKITAKSIDVLLNRLPHRGYLRLLDLDQKIIKCCFEEHTLQCIEKYIKNAAEEEWICPKCSWLISKKKRFWSCNRCMFRYHPRCATQKIVNSYSYCDTCIFKCTKL